MAELAPLICEQLIVPTQVARSCDKMRIVLRVKWGKVLISEQYLATMAPTDQGGAARRRRCRQGVNSAFALIYKGAKRYDRNHSYNPQLRIKGGIYLPRWNASSYIASTTEEEPGRIKLDPLSSRKSMEVLAK